MNKSFFLTIALTLMAVFTTLEAAPSGNKTFGINSDGQLDQNAIAKAYKESEWEIVVSTLQGYLRSKGDDNVDLNERIYAYKYLGVIFGADSAAHSKAESYFTRLVELSPNVEIVDLFPSKRVTELFGAVKADYQKRHQYSQQFDVYGHKTSEGKGGDDMAALAAKGSQSQPTSKSTKKPEPQLKDKDNGWVWWTVGLTAAVGAGVGAYYLTNKTEETTPTVVDGTK
jgi:hypothetical protein